MLRIQTQLFSVIANMTALFSSYMKSLFIKYHTKQIRLSDDTDKPLTCTCYVQDNKATFQIY